MKVKTLLFGLALLVGFGIVPASSFGGHGALSALLPGDPLEGSRLFIEKGCLQCHAVTGVGGVAGPELGRGILNRPLLEIAGVMWNHFPGMEQVLREKRVSRPTFEPSEMASLIAFLYYLNSLDPPGDPAFGARLFRQKGCEACHSLGGRGGSIGPALDKYGRYASPLFLTTDLWKKGKAMAETMREMGVSRPTFEGNDIPDLLAYIRDVAGGLERVYAPPGSPERGEKLYREKRCVECHAIRGHGAKVGPDLGTTLTGSLMRIAGAMWNHGPKMWEKMVEMGIKEPSLSTKQMSDLINYLYFFQFIDPAADPQRGRVVIVEKQCVSCHSFGGVRETVGPNLATAAGLGTPLEVITAMWNHASSMEEMMLEQDMAWPVFKGGEMADLIAYLLYMGGGSVELDGLKGKRK